MSPEPDNPAVRKLLEGYARLNGQPSADGRLSAPEGSDADARVQAESEKRVKESAARRNRS